MKLNLKRPIAFFDLETTGVNVAKDRIVEIAIQKIYPDGHVVKKPSEHEDKERYLLNPTIKIPPESTAIHGISDKDVEDAPTFAQIAKSLFKFLYDCDLAGFNSNKFDIPILAEEFLRCDIAFTMENRNLIDVQNIFHLMEQRTLKAAYKFYCGKDLVDAHEAMADVDATVSVFYAQLERYKGVEIENAEGKLYQPVVNDMEVLHKTSQRTRNVDFMGRIVYDKNGVECFNFGKHKGKPVEEVLQKEPGYYGWMMNGEFPRYTKRVLQSIKHRMESAVNKQ